MRYNCSDTVLCEELGFEKTGLIVLPSLLAAVLGLLLTHNLATQPVQAYSSGPHPVTRAPPAKSRRRVPNATFHLMPVRVTSDHRAAGLHTWPHVPDNSNSHQLGYDSIAVGIEPTALDTSDEKAGDLQSTDGLTQVLNNAGPGAARQYIEHTSIGTFIGQQLGAS